jgi:hypothetical protein
MIIITVAFFVSRTFFLPSKIYQIIVNLFYSKKMEEDIVCNRQSNKYDKVIRENAESLLPVIMKKVLLLNIFDSEEIPDDLQYTKERKPDVLKRVIDEEGNIFILHIEFQAYNDKDMAYRMAEYYVMLSRKYRIPVKQYVIFIGPDEANMPTEMDSENNKFSYEIIHLKDFDYHLFLDSDDPATKVIAILGHFGDENEDEAITNIVREVRAVAGGALAEEHFYNQLNILARLRNNNINLKLNKMTNTKTVIDESKDYLFRRGKAKGKEEGRFETQRQTAIKMKEHGFLPELIAEITNIPIEEVEMV